MRRTIGGEVVRATLAGVLAGLLCLGADSWWPVLVVALLWGLGCGPNDSGEGEYD